MHVQTKIIHGHSYLYAVENARVNGVSRKVKQVYLGKLEDLVANRMAQGRPRSVRTRRFGAVAALWALAEELGLRDVIDAECGTRSGPGASIGTYLVLAAINRIVEARSKRGFAAWYQGTSLERLAGVLPEALTSQAFWTAMDRFPEDAGERVLSKIAPKVLAEAGTDGVVAFDCSNFFTFIATGNPRSQLARRGHNKAKRHDLRQVGLALAVAGSSQLPLFYHVYAGNRPDVTIFKDVFPLLLRALKEVGVDDATLVYDKGNLSRANQASVDVAQASYVSSLPPHHFPDLLAIPLSEFKTIEEGTLTGFSWKLQQRQIWGAERTVVQSYSPVLAAGQDAGVQQHLDKALAKLQALKESLVRRQQPGYRGRKPTHIAIDKVVDAALRGQYLRRLLKPSVTEVDGHFDLDYEVDQVVLEELREHLFGRRIWITDHRDWDGEKIIHTAHQQNDVEASFRHLHADHALAWSPMYHWTDQKIAVHAFYCVMGLLLVRLLALRAASLGDHRGAAAILADLGQLDECVLVYPPAGGSGRGRPRLVSTLSEHTPAQSQLLQATGAMRFDPSGL